MLDFPRAYLQTRANGYGHREAWETTALVRHYGGIEAAAKSMVHSAGGFSGSSGGGLGWPNTFRKLTDPWPERAGFDGYGLPLDQIWRNSTVQSCLSWIQRNFPEARPRVMTGAGEDAAEVVGHPLTELLRRPNPHYTGSRLWQVTLSDWWITGRGNAYWRKVRSRSGEPVELWHVPAAEIEPEWPRDGSAFISHYRRTVNGRTENIDPADIIHFRFGQDPLNARKGWSPLLAGAAEIAVLNEGAEYRGALLSNHAIPSYSMTPKDEQVAEAMDPDKTAALERLWKSKYTGRNRGALFIPNFAATLERIGFSPQELDIRELMEWDADIVCALFGLNSMVLGLPSGEKHRTFANGAEAREAATESNLIPCQRLFAEDLDLQLLPEFSDRRDERVDWDTSRVRVLQDDQNKLYQRLDTAVQGKWMLPNEARAKVNLQPNPEMDARALAPPEPPALPPGQMPPRQSDPPAA